MQTDSSRELAGGLLKQSSCQQADAPELQLVWAPIPTPAAYERKKGSEQAMASDINNAPHSLFSLGDLVAVGDPLVDLVYRNAFPPS